MEALKLVLIIILIVIVIVGLFVAGFISIYPQDLLVVKSAIRKGKDIDDFDVSGRKHEDKIRKILAKHNYTYQRIDLEPEVRKIYGLGQATYADGSCEFYLYTSKNCFSVITKGQYLSLQSELGKEITFHSYDMKWRKNTAEKKES